MLDKKLYFQRQIEECRELARHSVNAENRAFWLQAAERWEDLLKQKLRDQADQQQRVA